MSDTREAQCPTCGEPLPAGAPENLCPRCLLGAVDPEVRPGGPPALPVPDIEELSRLFPRYQIQELIGQGGMGAVFKAHHLKLDRPVAVKVLPQTLGEDPTFAERFLREARAMARLDHPFVVTIHDFGEVEGTYYLVMEYVEGRNLRRLMEEGLTAQQALAIVPQVCEALAYAHERGIVHRDIKPENILLDTHGRVRIADFGLAKLVQPDRDQQTLTGTYQVMGTLHYMAPEQFEKPTEVDHRADIFSLGVVFYEMLTGQLPLGRFDAPSETKQGLDVRLDEVVMKSLERKREKRYQEASEVKTDVEQISASPEEPRLRSPASRPVRSPRTASRPSRRAAGPEARARKALIGVMWSAGLTLLFSFLSWAVVSYSFADTGIRVTATLWEPVHFNTWGINLPMWIFVIAALGLGVAAVLQSAGHVAVSWKAYAFGGAFCALWVLLFCFVATDAKPEGPTAHVLRSFRVSPGPGAILTFCALAGISYCGFLLRPAPEGGRRRRARAGPAAKRARHRRKAAGGRRETGDRKRRRL